MVFVLTRMRTSANVHQRNVESSLVYGVFANKSGIAQKQILAVYPPVLLYSSNSQMTFFTSTWSMTTVVSAAVGCIAKRSEVTVHAVKRPSHHWHIGETVTSKSTAKISVPVDPNVRSIESAYDILEMTSCRFMPIGLVRLLQNIGLQCPSSRSANLLQKPHDNSTFQPNSYLRCTSFYSTPKQIAPANHKQGRVLFGFC
jgi:hypothetical protein